LAPRLALVLAVELASAASVDEALVLGVEADRRGAISSMTCLDGLLTPLPR
jgi:hypothetical protein